MTILLTILLTNLSNFESTSGHNVVIIFSNASNLLASNPVNNYTTYLPNVNTKSFTQFYAIFIISSFLSSYAYYTFSINISFSISI